MRGTLVFLVVFILGREARCYVCRWVDVLTRLWVQCDSDQPMIRRMALENLLLTDFTRLISAAWFAQRLLQYLHQKLIAGNKESMMLGIICLRFPHSCTYCIGDETVCCYAPVSRSFDVSRALGFRFQFQFFFQFFSFYSCFRATWIAWSAHNCHLHITNFATRWFLLGWSEICVFPCVQFRFDSLYIRLKRTNWKTMLNLAS